MERKRCQRQRGLQFGVYGLCALLWACAPPYETDPAKLFDGRSAPAFHEYTIEDRNIHYAAAGETQRPLVIFLHGTPGSWKAFAEFLAQDPLVDRARLIAVDRPGFGKSDYKELLPSLARQTHLLHPLLNQDTTGCGAILVGHSLGAPLAVRMAMEFPEQVGGMVLIAPSIDPDLEDPRWYNHLASYRAVNWAVPTPLVLANREVMALQGELREMMPLWERMSSPVTVIQGGKDKLVMPANADFVERMVKGPLKMVRIPDAGHFILWEQPDIIIQEILIMLDSLGLDRQGLCRNDRPTPAPVNPDPRKGPPHGGHSAVEAGRIN